MVKSNPKRRPRAPVSLPLPAKPARPSPPSGERLSAEDEVLALESLAGQPILSVPDSSKILRMKRFRTQLLHHWLINRFEPCRVADVGGGKGLLSYLLIHSGWEAAVIDPGVQPLPDKYKDIAGDVRVKIDPAERVPGIAEPFREELARGFDLLVGMHAHGCNVAIIDAAARFGCGFVLFPCCVIDEPLYPRLGVLWVQTLAAYALERGCQVFPFRLNFKGQNIGLCFPGGCRPRHPTR